MKYLLSILILFFTLALFGQKDQIKSKRIYEKVRSLSAKTDTDSFRLRRVIEYDTVGRILSNTKVTSWLMHSTTDSNDFVHKYLYKYEEKSDNYTKISVRGASPLDSCFTYYTIKKSSTGKTQKETRITRCPENEYNVHFEYEYNDIDSLTEKRHYEDGELTSTDTYIYDHKNRYSEIFIDDPIILGTDFYNFPEKYSIKFTYTLFGRREIHTYKEKVKWHYEKKKRTYFYNKKDQLKKVIFKSKPVDLFDRKKGMPRRYGPKPKLRGRSGKLILEYNSDGQLIKETSSGLLGGHSSSRFFHYNDKGDLIKEYIDDILDKYYKYEYWGE